MSVRSFPARVSGTSAFVLMTWAARTPTRLDAAAQLEASYTETIDLA